MRIIAGQYKGRELLPPPGRSQTRPITGSVKKSLFGMLGEDFTGRLVLDLYCGTGTLGIEALSRGAEQCYFAELDRSVVHRLRQNLSDVGAAGRGVVWQGDILARLAKWLAELPRPADVAFVDPPYVQAETWDWPAVEQSLFAPLAARMADDGVVVLRLPTRAVSPPALGGLALTRSKTYGDMLVSLYEKSVIG